MSDVFVELPNQFYFKSESIVVVLTNIDSVEVLEAEGVHEGALSGGRRTHHSKELSLVDIAAHCDVAKLYEILLLFFT